MSSKRRDELIVVVDGPDLGRARPVGVLTLWPDNRAIAFAYARSWLQTEASFQLDPQYPLHEGYQYGARGDEVPPILRDTMPDAWGTALLERRAGQQLGPWDLLVGVSDEMRMGALRLCRTLEGPYLADDEPQVPPVAQLRALEEAARLFERDQSDPAVDAELDLLVAPGSSLGGARPKANFRDPDGTLWIAKFPSRTDRHDSGAWEHVYSDLAAKAGITVPETRLERLSDSGRTFVVRRFDRSVGRRVLFSSAMTLAQRRDGEAADYLDMVRAIRTFGAPGALAEELEQLFRRLVFNIVAGNRDDHLRNHGFLRRSDGWRLSPAFDMNPARAAQQHSLALSERAPTLAGAVGACRLFGLGEAKARDIIDQVVVAVSAWRDVARQSGISEREIDVVGEVVTLPDDRLDR